MPKSNSPQSLRLALAAGAVALLCVSTAIRYSYGSLNATITNTGNSLGSGTLLYTHTYGPTTCSSVPVSGGIPATSTFPCTGGLQPTTATPASGSASATDSIHYQGTAPAAGITQLVSAASCGPVKLDNTAHSSNPMMVRYGTTFSPSSGPMTSSGSIALDGGSPGGYETAVLSQSQPDPALSLGSTYGLGIWFKTSSTSGGPLFEISTSAVNATASDDRVLYMRANGRLSFIQSLVGPTTTTTNSYNDGAWHFAYVTLQATRVILNLFTTTTIYVDGDAAVTGGGLLTGYTADTGYWHVGFSPNSVTGVPAYFTGSLSNFVVFNTPNAPARPTAGERSSQSNFDTWASSATEHWLMNDSGTTTFAGSYPMIGATSPCTMVNVSWGFTNPTSCAWSPHSLTNGCTDPPASSLSSFVSAGSQTIAVPDPDGTQTATLKASRGGTYNTLFVPGLHLYTPLTFQATCGNWVNTFTWSDSGSVFLA